MLNKKQKMLFEKQAKIVKAISHPLRIAIVDFLKNDEQCVCNIAKHIGSEQSNVSRHLSLMVNAGLLSFRKEGLKVIYKLQTPCVLDFLKCVTKCLKEQTKENKKLLKSL